MARKSSIDTLPPDILEQLQALLRDPRMTQLGITAQINALLADKGEEQVSKSAVNRYAVKMDKIGSKLQQSRQIADMWIGKLGTQPAGQVGNLLNEVVRNLAFDTAIQLSEDEEPASPKLIKELAMAIAHLEKAASDNDKRRREIEQEATQKARAAAAEQAAQTAQLNGVSPETIERIRRDVLGMAA
jgi:hypothetical protein